MVWKRADCHKYFPTVVFFKYRYILQITVKLVATDSDRCAYFLKKLVKFFLWENCKIVPSLLLSLEPEGLYLFKLALLVLVSVALCYDKKEKT